MSGLIDAIFKPQAAKPQGPSQAEVSALKKEENILKSKKAVEAAGAEGRTNILRARRLGPQTLFAGSGGVPPKVTLGGGTRR